MAKKAKTAKKKAAKKTVKKTAVKKGPRRPIKRAAPVARARRAVAKARAARPRVDPLFAPVQGAERRTVGHVVLDVGKAGAARVKRMIYPAGFRWSVDMKPAIGGDYCMHAHVGFLVHGEIHIQYADGCVVEHRAPQIVAIDPGHDGWVVGTEPAVIIEFDFGGQTVERLGMPASHAH